MTTHNEHIRTELRAAISNSWRDPLEAKIDSITGSPNITVVRTEDLAAILYLAGITVKEDAQNHNVFGDPVVASMLLDSYYRLDEKFNTAAKTAAEVVSEY